MRVSANPAVSVERFFQFSLLGLVTSGYLAVAGSGYLDTPTMALTALGLLVRALAVAGIIRLEIPERYVTAVTLAYIGFFPIDFLLISGDFLDATVHMVFFVAITKVITAHTDRDYVFTALIAFLELLAAAILSSNLNFFAFLSLYLLFAMAAFTSSEIRRSVHKTRTVARSGLRRFSWRLTALTLFVTFGILALTAGLFFMLPRTAGAALERLVSRRIILPGFSNQVNLGQIGQIKNRSRAVMHVGLSSREAGAAAKWRGAALSEFDGRRWFNPPEADTMLRLNDGQVTLSRREERPGLVYYFVEMSGVDTDALFIAGAPHVLEMRPRSLFRTIDDNYRLHTAPVQGFRYGVYSFLDDRGVWRRSGASLEEKLVRRYLQLPRLDPRVAELARTMTAGAASDEQRARAIENRLRRDYAYTLQLPSRESADPLANFLFIRRKGHCEYFASAMTVMLRTLGIPARLVNGFQSGTWNPYTEMYVIRESDAHSWVEAWMPGRGWTVFDPTPPDPDRGAVTLWSQLALYLDAAETFWQEWVLGYDPGQQAKLADKAQRSGRLFGHHWMERAMATVGRWRAAATAAVKRYGMPALASLAAALLAWRLFPILWRRANMHRRVRRVRRGQARADDATLLYARMLEVLARRGYQKPAWFTAGEFAATLPPDLATPVAEFNTAYHALRFGGRVQAAPRLSALLERIEGRP